ncbi:hypothetical protein NQ315_015571 [Exocentrus adspersus]|uniref:Serine palmitoyltransferase small subunit A n=1 Tax=Exocentrus adspersus TaxID=1586481 RepID=A0AAV8V9Y6_9CUCU|nr:hypothetical protein NQ315_015571 [Exocentrus adspersus]
MFSSIKNFISYWYFRYLLVTELYMVEKWERAMFHIILFVLLAIMYVFNTTVTLGLVRMIINSLTSNEDSKRTDYLIDPINVDNSKYDL